MAVIVDGAESVDDRRNVKVTIAGEYAVAIGG